MPDKSIESAAPLVRLRNLKQWNGEPARPGGTSSGYLVDVPALDVPAGEFVVLRGSSGCGKTTLLQVLGLLRRPSEVAQFAVRTSHTGDIVEVPTLWEKDTAALESLRRKFVGFALQSGELLQNLTVLENVMMPLRLNGIGRIAARKRARQLLRRLGPVDEVTRKPTLKLLERARKFPKDISGGESQRVVIARAVAHGPPLLLLDEPTNNLDPLTAAEALKLLDRLRVREGLTVVMVTHDEDLARQFGTRMIVMKALSPGLGGVAGYHARIDGEWVDTDAEWNVPTTEIDIETNKTEVEAVQENAVAVPTGDDA